MVNKHNEEFLILKNLIESSGSSKTILQLSKERDINYKSCYNNIEKLLKRGIIDVNKAGNSKLCSFNYKFDELVYSVEYYRLNNILRMDKNLKVLYEHLKKVNLPFILLLFGSYVKGGRSKKSDIDFLVVAEDFRELDNIIDIFSENLDVTRISYDDFVQMLKLKEFNVVNEAVKKNIIFFGVEDYYRLISNVGGK